MTKTKQRILVAAATSIVAGLLSIVIGAAPVPAAPALVTIDAKPAAPVAEQPHVLREVKQPAVKTPPGPVAVYPNRNEGVISMVTRTCGSSKGWQSEAANNHVTPPEWKVLYGDPFTVTCGLTNPVSAPVVQQQNQNTAVAPSNAAWVAPLPGKCLQPNGSREYGTQRSGHIHRGIDLGMPTGTPVHAIHAGTIGYGYEAGGAGIYVTLNHGDGTASTYFHLSSRAVPNGAHVVAGEVIGYVGETGNADGAHLHFETHIPLWGNRVNPVTFMADRGVNLLC